MIINIVVTAVILKWSVIISNKHDAYELAHEFPNDLRLKILGNQEISG